MYDLTHMAIWKDRTDRFIDSLTGRLTFFGGSHRNILFEQACEGKNTCNTDQRSFKGYLARNIGYTMMIYPESRARLSKLLTASAEAAAKACTGIAPQLGIFQDVCSLKWTANDGVFDGSTSYGDVVGQFLSVLETLQANLAVLP
jgi:mannan endo-1,6-alpha-mannosidase